MLIFTKGTHAMVINVFAKVSAV